MIPTGNGSWNFITERIFKCCLQSGKGLVKVLRTGRNLIFFYPVHLSTFMKIKIHE